MMFDRRFVRDGRFMVDGVGLEETVAARGTPCYVYSASVMREKLKLLRESFPGFDICYSLKANPNLEVVRALARAGAGAEISSRGELAVVLRAGVNPSNIIFVGPAKQRPDIEAAVGCRVYAIVVDSAEELALVDECCERAAAPMRVLLRINTHEPSPEAKEVMVGGPSKFGFDEELVVDAVRGVRLRHARVVGIQVYSASGVLDAGYLAGHLEYVVGLAGQLAQELDIRLECIDFGGGFGVPYEDGQPELDLVPVAAAARRLREDWGHDPNSGDGIGSCPVGCRLVFECGRYLVAESGVFCTRVVRVKESRGKVLAITDGGMNAFARPVFMRVHHPARLLNRLDEPATTDVSVCGPICTPMDCIGPDVTLPMPQVGDVVGVLNAGAYGYTMSLLEFMSLGRPAELLVDAGQLRVIREPQPSASEQSAG